MMSLVIGFRVVEADVEVVGTMGGMLGGIAIIHPCGRWMESVEERATYAFVSLALQKIEYKV
jgi:hypothetical protein